MADQLADHFIKIAAEIALVGTSFVLYTIVYRCIPASVFCLAVSGEARFCSLLPVARLLRTGIWVLRLRLPGRIRRPVYSGIQSYTCKISLREEHLAVILTVRSTVTLRLALTS
jgi:hypothetical protein